MEQAGGYKKTPAGKGICRCHMEKIFELSGFCRASPGSVNE